jgi:hypothetical protein
MPTAVERPPLSIEKETILCFHVGTGLVVFKKGD